MNYIIFAFLFLSQITFAQRSPSLQCVDISFNQPEYEDMAPRELYRFLNNQDTDSAVRELIEHRNVGYSTHWLHLKVPHLHNRTIGLYGAFQTTHSRYRQLERLGSDQNSWLDQAIKFFSPEGLQEILPFPVRATATPEEVRTRMTTARRNDETGLGGMLQKNPMLLKIACAGITPLKMNACARALRYAFKNFYQSGNLYNLGNGWLVEIMTDHRAAEGGFRLAHKMLTRIRDKDFADASIIDDAYQSFRQPGVASAITDKMAETFLLLSLVHGQLSYNSYRLGGLVQPFNHATLTAAEMTAVASASLDSLIQKSSPKGQLYTLPSQVTNVCDNGKPYHFLAPWYISLRLQEKGFSRNISAQIAFYSDWAYQVFSQSRGRDPFDNVTEGYRSQRNQSHRLDLLYASLGALYGSRQLTASSNPDHERAFNRTQENVRYIFRKPLPIKTQNGRVSPVNLARISVHSVGRFFIHDFFKQLKN